MPNSPLLSANVKITARDINGNLTTKQFNSVMFIHIDYTDGTINIVDVTGSFYFGLTPVTSFAYTIAGGVASIVIS